MTRIDLIKQEVHLSDTYRREAKSRRSKNPAMADQLLAWAEASMRRVEAMKCGPLFVAGEP